LNEAFRSHGLRYQDAPDLCSLKLHREMANSVDDPLKTHYRISGTELDDYRDSHSSKAAKALYPRKVGQDFTRCLRFLTRKKTISGGDLVLSGRAH
jgi:hypothetical protein